LPAGWRPSRASEPSARGGRRGGAVPGHRPRHAASTELAAPDLPRCQHHLGRSDTRWGKPFGGGVAAGATGSAVGRGTARPNPERARSKRSISSNTRISGRPRNAQAAQRHPGSRRGHRSPKTRRLAHQQQVRNQARGAVRWQARMGAPAFGRLASGAGKPMRRNPAEVHQSVTN